MVKDPLVHIDKSMLSDILPVTVFKTVTTGCDKRRPPEMISSSPEDVTCPECRAFATRWWHEIAGSAQALLRFHAEMPQLTAPDLNQIRQEEAKARRTAARFQQEAGDPEPGPEPELEFECCGSWLPYPGPGETTRCPRCGSTFVLAGQEQETGQ